MVRGEAVGVWCEGDGWRVSGRAGEGLRVVGWRMGAGF